LQRNKLIHDPTTHPDEIVFRLLANGGKPGPVNRESRLFGERKYRRHFNRCRRTLLDRKLFADQQIRPGQRNLAFSSGAATPAEESLQVCDGHNASEDTPLRPDPGTPEKEQQASDPSLGLAAGIAKPSI
jgi:hypothetical protein